MYYIGVDLGTSAVKLLLMDKRRIDQKHCLKRISLVFPKSRWNAVVRNRSRRTGGMLWLRGIKELTDGFDNSEYASRWRGISFGGQMHGLVILDADDNVIRPAILWNDGRTTKTSETNYLNDVIGKGQIVPVHKANIAFAGFTAPKILWVKEENEPENFAKIAKIMLPKDYIAYKMTGVHSCDYSDASGMQYLWVSVGDSFLLCHPSVLIFTFFPNRFPAASFVYFFLSTFGTLITTLEDRPEKGTFCNTFLPFLILFRSGGGFWLAARKHYLRQKLYLFRNMAFLFYRCYILWQRNLFSFVPEKADMDTVVTASGISKVLRFLQLAKSYCLISFMPFGSLIFVRDVQPTNSPLYVFGHTVWYNNFFQF